MLGEVRFVDLCGLYRLPAPIARPLSQRTSPFMRRVIVAAWILVAGFPATLLAQAPALTGATPSACLPGQSVDIALTGTALAKPTNLWTNIPGSVTLAPDVKGNGTQAGQVVYRFAIPAGAPIGIYGLRIATGQGVSSPKLLMIDDIPTLPEKAANKSVADAQVLTLPIAIDGACEAESWDYFKFTAAAGQRVSVEVVARRLGSVLDPVIRLLDAHGRELAYSDDEPGLGPDCRLSHQFAAAGDYILELRDIRYQGSANHRYRLRVGDFPLVTAPYPLAGAKGSSAQLAVAGPMADGLPPLSVAVPKDVPGDRLLLGIKYPHGQSSAAATLVASDLLEQVELEPNDTRETSSPVNVPGAINGRFAAANDRDFFRFDGKKGQHFVFVGRTRSLGSPTDLFMRIYKADGTQLAEAEDAGTEEGSIDFTLPDDGTYHLMVEDLLRRGGPEHVYRVEVEVYKPGFSLSLDADKYDAPLGGVMSAKVTAVRKGYTGPITLSLVGAPAGCVLANNVIAEAKPDTQLSVTVPAGLTPGQLLTLGLVGEGKIGDAKTGETKLQAKASTLAALSKLYSGLSTPPASLDGSIGVGIGPVFADFFKFEVEPAVVPLPQLVGSSTFKLKVTKLNKFDDKITLAVSGLPAGVTATVPPSIDKGAALANITLQGPAALAPGEYTFRITGSATFQNQPKTVTLGDVKLRVVDPVGVTVTPAGPLTPGGKQKVKIALTRYAAEKEAATIAFKDLPKGITVPANLTVAADKNEVETEVSAAADVTPGSIELVAVAAMNVKGRPVVANSAATALEIKKP